MSKIHSTYCLHALCTGKLTTDGLPHVPEEVGLTTDVTRSNKMLFSECCKVIAKSRAFVAEITNNLVHRKNYGYVSFFSKDI